MTDALRLPLASALVAALVLASAFAIIDSTHRSRALYAQLQELEGRRWYLEEERSRLLLEQGTWSSHHRIATEANDTLGLAAPEHEYTRLLAR
jgi:cell division protein FtsL